ncbi:MAG TPA: hypothetical protein VGY54_13395 [Polyangiaceae bacterium]|nr:hypothetical protein [Polyangiaceae bacterium]
MTVKDRAVAPVAPHCDIVERLSPVPPCLSEQVLAARRQRVTYGHWKIRHHSEPPVEMVYESEYRWIESAIAGAAAGTFEACGIAASIETRLTDRFNGPSFI